MKKRIALGERSSEIGQSTDKMRVALLKGNAILTRSVLFYRKKC
jgi:hypothetical protein